MSVPSEYFQRIISAQNKGKPKGLVSICSSNFKVLEAAISQAENIEGPLLIESTSNQVNQCGGYMDLTPLQFKEKVHAIAKKYNLPQAKILLGGDHLGVQPWPDKPEAEALEKGCRMVHDYARAGFSKIHLDASIPLRDDDSLDPETVFARTASLCRAAEEGFAARKKNNPQASPPVYVIGSEVPFPGGDFQANAGPEVTSRQDLDRTISVAEKHFADNNLDEAWQRVVAIVVQTGVEFEKYDIYDYDSSEFQVLTEMLQNDGRFVFEGHSSDYQRPGELKKMVSDRIAILKVGPALTFALREALFSLEMMEKELLNDGAGRGDQNGLSNFSELLDREMQQDPGDWEKYYQGSEPEQRLARKYSYFDRCRYYISRDIIQQAADRLLGNLAAREIPLPLVSQYLPQQYRRIRQGELSPNPEELIKDHILETLTPYFKAADQYIPE